MRSKLPLFFLCVLTFSVSTSVMARDIQCGLPGDTPTVNGIRTLHFHKDDWKGSGTITLTRDGEALPETVPAFLNLNELSWGERERTLVLGSGVYSVTDSVVLQKSKNDDGKSSFLLVKEREILSGPHCDGYHSCHESNSVLASISITCTDTDDLRKPRSESSSHCNHDQPGDCE